MTAMIEFVAALARLLFAIACYIAVFVWGMLCIAATLLIAVGMIVIGGVLSLAAKR